MALAIDGVAMSLEEASGCFNVGFKGNFERNREGDGVIEG
jgi:hypothetical protein